LRYKNYRKGLDAGRWMPDAGMSIIEFPVAGIRIQPIPSRQTYKIPGIVRISLKGFIFSHPVLPVQVIHH
jgi:hypothetical protein